MTNTQRAIGVVAAAAVIQCSLDLFVLVHAKLESFIEIGIETDSSRVRVRKDRERTNGLH